MVLLPGYFVHLLNVSIEYEPCHHIMLHSKYLNKYIHCVIFYSYCKPTSHVGNILKKGINWS